MVFSFRKVPRSVNGRRGGRKRWTRETRGKAEAVEGEVLTQGFVGRR